MTMAVAVRCLKSNTNPAICSEGIAGDALGSSVFGFENG
jgi:hypothetical protein